jgi:hypothetical protein
MNEIAIIEFESFRENIALDDTALTPLLPPLFLLTPPFVSPDFFKPNKRAKLQLKRKTFPLLKHGGKQAKVLISNRNE